MNVVILRSRFNEWRMNTREDRSGIGKRILASGVLVVAFLFGFSSAGWIVLANEPGTLTLSVGIYSGLPNPKLDLQEAEAVVVFRMLSEANPRPANDPATIFRALSYYGLSVARWGTNNLIESVTEIRGTNIFVAGSRIKPSSFSTQDTRLEDYLLNLAYSHGVISFDMYDYILCEINPRRRTFYLSINKSTSGSPGVSLNWPCVPGSVEVLHSVNPIIGSWNPIAFTNGTTCTIALTNAMGFFRVLRLMPPN